MTHSDLVPLAAKWLSRRCAVVVTEIATLASEQPDALGWEGSLSRLIECKATRSDFLADREKMFRKVPELGVGQMRYFLAPAGVIGEDELPPNWGLIEVTGAKVKCRREASRVSQYNHNAELTILLSALRRIGKSAPDGVSIRYYTFQTKNRATLGLEEEIGNLPTAHPTP